MTDLPLTSLVSHADSGLRFVSVLGLLLIVGGLTLWSAPLGTFLAGCGLVLLLFPAVTIVMQEATTAEP